MRAIVQQRYGEAGDVLRPAEIERPEAGEGEVVVQVAAAGVDRGAWHLMTGLPYLLRLAGFGVRRPKRPVRGREFAGRVDAVGPGVTQWHVGDEVFGIAEGCFAEYALARADRILTAPPRLTPVQAAALPISGLTALQAVRDHGRVQPGQEVLVIGASGGVGTFAVQIAKAYGATVTGVASTAKLDVVRAVGADRVVDYTREDVAGLGSFDVVLDIGGNRPLRVLRRLLTPTGRLVIVGGETGGRLLGGTDRQVRAMILSRFVRQTLTSYVASENAADLAVLAELVADGAVTPVVERTVPLARTAEAVQHVADGRARGKVVVEIG